MKNSNLYILLAFATLLAACSSNQDLASLEEYDDVYYQGGSELSASLSTTPETQESLDGASNAERSYYENVPYTEPEAEPEPVNSDTDYYDEDYANRIENFNGSNQGQYLYSDPTYNNSPNINVGFGVGTYGSGFGMSMMYGSPGYMGLRSNMMFSPMYSPWYSPWYSPYYSPWYQPYPLYGWNTPFYDPFCPYGGGFYGGGYYGGGYYGGSGYPPYYGGDYNGNNGITSTPRQGSSSVRPSRGGVITEGRSDGSARNEIAAPTDTRRGISSAERPVETRKSANTGEKELSESRRVSSASRTTESVELRNRNVQSSESSREYYNSSEAREYTRPGTSRSDDVRREEPVRSRSERTPSRTYIQQRSPQRDAVAPASRSRSTTQPSNGYNRQRSSGNSTPTRSTSPSRNYNSGGSSPSRSVSPSPSRSVSPSGGGGSNSRSSSPSRGSRR